MTASWDLEASSSQAINYGDLTILDGATEFTMVAWINAESSVGTDVGVIGKWAGGTEVAYLMQIDTDVADVIKFAMQGPDTTANDFNIGSTTTSVSTGTWMHFVGTWDFSRVSAGTDSGWRAFVDGVTDTVTHNAVDTDGTSVANSTAPLYVGLQEANSGYYDGKIAYCALYDRALTASEVAEIYVNPNSIVNGRVWATNLNNSGNIGVDISGNGNDPTATAGAASTDGPPVFFPE